MKNQLVRLHSVLLMLPALVLIGYVLLMTRMYWPYLNGDLHLRSPELAGLPEEVIGFWMWWPFIALLFVVSLASALLLSGIRRRVFTGTSFLAVFLLLSAADYLLCEKLVEELLRF